ncbi:hypothetical protein [Alistipes sp.]|uniref:hypothetical protein n=1 Tax=Alistipes sp. TaxID=1872444 RepID=UPI003AF0C81F
MTDSYETLSVGKYEKLLQARADYEQKDVNALNLAILAILTDRSEEELLDLKLPEFRALTDRAGFLRTAPRPEPVARRYRLKEYDLRPVTDVRRMTAAQYIDFQTFAREETGCTAELLSCFLIPRGRRYNDGYDIREVQAAIRESLPITRGLGLLAFFLKKSRQSTISTLRSSIRTMKRTKPTPQTLKAMSMAELSMALLKSGDGSLMSMPLLS